MMTISQLSPAMAAINMDMQEDLPPPTWKVPPQAPKATTATHDVLPTAPSAYTAKGYLKKQVSKNSDAKSVKAAKASKKLNQLRGRDSPRKRSTLGKSSTAPPSSTVPRNEVFPFAKSKKICVSLRFGGVPETTQ